MTGKALSGQVALVTGASKGIGRGIALQLGEAGAVVYVTGRKKEGDSTLADTANEITNRGGKGIAVYVDHENQKQVEALFEQIAKEQNGRLDILVNNAYAAVSDIFHATGKKFHELPIEIWDKVNNTGLRNHYVCSVLAARLMVPRKSGLIVIVSSQGGLCHLFNTAYGVGKAACDRLAADIAHELKADNITAVSLWPGAVKTEFIQKNVIDSNRALKGHFEGGESTEYSGKCLAALAADANRLQKSGQIVTTVALGKEYHLVDLDGSTPAPVAPQVEKVLATINAVRTNISSL